MSSTNRRNEASDWALIEDLFHKALDQPETLRTAWVAQHTTEAAVRSEVNSLLAALKSQEGAPIEPASAPLHSPCPADGFGGYKLEKALGQGGMGTVYLAHRADGEFEHRVAVKVLASHLIGDEFLKKFQNERRLLASLTHANITQLHDSGVSSGGAPYLVMEYVEGEPLDRYCNAHLLGIEERLRLFLQVCEAVDYAHRNLIVHRDLKPGNIFVNGDGVVKLLDFGTASLMVEDSPSPATVIRMLTPRYACPERLRGERARPAHDVFSLGVILYELLVGAWPYGDPTSVIVELERAMGESSPVTPSTAATEEAARTRALPLEKLKRTIQGDLTAITLKAIDDDPGMRYLSVRELAEDVTAYLEGRPVRARKQTLLYRGRKFVRRNWVPVSAAAVLAAGLSLAGLLVVRQDQVAKAEARKSDKVNQFLSDMLSSAADSAPDALHFTVAQMLDAALPKLETSWKDDPAVEAALRMDLASSYLTLFEVAKSRTQYARALEIFRRRGDENGIADALTGLGLVSSASGNTDDELRYFRAAVDSCNRMGRAASPKTAVFAKLNLAEFLTLSLDRDFDNALRLVDEALALCARNPSLPPTYKANAYFVRGAALSEQGNYAEAEIALQRAIEILRQQKYDGLLEGRALYALMILSNRQRNAPAAMGYARQLFELNLRRLSMSHPVTIQSKIMMDRSRADAGDAGAAAQDAVETLPSYRKLFPALAANLWNPLTNTAHCLNLAGRFREAEPLSREAVAIMNSGLYRTADPRRGESLFELGTSLEGQKKVHEAVSVFEESSQNYEHAGPAWARRAKEIRERAEAIRQ